MYRTCVFCYGDLGENQSIEACPIGRRLAFDPAKGRLWVVCRRCERWNLTPFEERWEALEACERRYRGTRLRYSTDNIGLARLAEGLELVRIGEPLRPELAAWRYGDQFGRRRRRHLAMTGLVVAGVPLLMLGSYGLLAAIGISGTFAMEVPLWLSNLHYRRTLTTLPVEAGSTRLKLNKEMLERVAIAQDPARGWVLLVPTQVWVKGDGHLQYGGEQALDILQRLLPIINRRGGSARTVQGAVARLEAVPDPVEQVHQLAHSPTHSWLTGDDYTVCKQPPERRLALEMLLREAHEERSLRGELWRLEREWRQAEELASIADQLLSTPAEDEQLERLRRGKPSDA